MRDDAPDRGCPPATRTAAGGGAARGAHARAGASRPTRPRTAAADRRSGRRQDQDADPPDRTITADRRGAAVGDPRGHVLGARGRRAATAARRSARRTGRARRHRGHVSLDLRAHAQRARRRVRPHRELHRLRPGRRAPRDRMAALRPAARADPAGARRLRAAGGRRGARRDLAGQEPAALPRQLRAGGAAHRRAADRRRVARGRDRAAALKQLRLRRPLDACGAAARRAPAPARVLPPALALAAGRRVPGHQRGAERPCRFAGGSRRQRLLRRGRRPAALQLARGGARNILAFGERFPAHARIVLGRNFRCRSEILDPAVACVAHNAQRESEGADRDARLRRPRAGDRVRLRPPRGRDRRGRDRPDTRPRHPRRRGAGARAHRLRDRAAAGRARPRRDPASRARQPRAVRALRGPRRARLPRAARQPRRRPGVQPRRRLTKTRRRRRNRQPRRPRRPRNPPGRPDHGKRARERDREYPTARRPRPAHAVRRRTRPRPSRAARTDARSATSSSPR